jgi:5'-3' exonuclease
VLLCTVECEGEQSGYAFGKWDHNVITPGTPFMARVARFLRRYAQERVSSGSVLWRQLAVVIDDSSVPGEGEVPLGAAPG